MELVSPGLGLIFWKALAFGIVLIILRKYAWRPILSTIKEREHFISNSIRHGKRIHQELAELDATKEKLLIQAKEKASEVIKQAKLDGEEIIQKANRQARQEANQIIEAAKNSIMAERKAAEREIRQQIILLSMDVASKVMQKEFSDQKRNDEFISKLLDEIQLN